MSACARAADVELCWLATRARSLPSARRYTADLGLVSVELPVPGYNTLLVLLPVVALSEARPLGGAPGSVVRVHAVRVRAWRLLLVFVILYMIVK